MIMRAVAIMRERYGFTAGECLEMTMDEFEEWLGALDDSKEDPNDGEVAVNVETGQCIDPCSIRQRVQKHFSNG
jgi:hypothetical protein